TSSLAARPEDRRPLHESKTDAVLLDDQRPVCLLPVQAGARHRDTEFLQPGQRRPNGVLAVRDVVSTSHASEASEFQGLARDGTGVEAFAGPVERHLIGGVVSRWGGEQAPEVGGYT